MPRLSTIKRLLQDLRSLRSRSPEYRHATHSSEASAAHEQIEVDSERLETTHLSNPALPVNQLPNELLIRIFVLASLKSTISLLSPHAKDMDTPAWMKLMLVCRYWRDVALATPTLWRFIEMGRDVRWTKIALTRSDPATIDVDVGHHYISSDEFDLLYPHAYRIRRLDFYDGNHEQRSSVLTTLFDLGMPALEELAFCRNPYIGPTLPHQADIHAKLSSQQNPHLRVLCLSRVAIPRDRPLYAKLRTLILIECSCDLSLDEFLGIISSCSSTLRKLCLVSFLDRLSGNWAAGATTSRPPINLPRMRVMVLRKHDASYLAHFLAHLSLPSKARIEVHAEGGVFLPSDPRAKGSLLDAIPSNHTMSFPVLGAVTRAELDLQGYTYIVRGATQRWGTTYPLELKYDTAQRPVPGGFAPIATQRELLPRSLDDLIAVLRGSSLRCLSIRGVLYPVSQTKWQEVLAAFPHLEELRVGDDGPMVSLIGALQFEPSVLPSSIAEHSVERPTPGFLCPKLWFLALELECDFYSTLTGLLIDCVQSRAEKDLRLHKLEVRSFSPPDEIEADWKAFVRGLEGLVPDVSYVVQPAAEFSPPKNRIINWWDRVDT